MHYLYWAVVGLLAGALGKLIMPGKDPGGIFVMMLIGLAGAYVGGFLGRLAGFGVAEGASFFGNVITATAGAVVLLFGYRVIKSRQASE